MTKKTLSRETTIKNEKKTYLFIGNVTDEQVDELTHYIHSAFETYDGSFDDVILVCDRGIKFGGY